MSAAIYDLLMNIIGLYMFIIFAWVIASWLQGFGIVNPRNQMMQSILRGLNGLVEPAVRPIRKVLPSIGGLDLSPIVLLFALSFIQRFIHSFYTTGSIL
jgi:YggT family protein